MTYDVHAVREQFPTLKEKIHGKSLVYLDSAATALKPMSVINAVTDHYARGTSNVHRGIHFLSDQATAAFESARERVRSFLNAGENEIVFTHGTTESINIVASGLQSRLSSDDEILVTELEHHSNFVPWQMLAQKTGAKLKVATVLEDGSLNLESFRQLLSSKTKIVAVTALSNTVGCYVDIAEIVTLSHKFGAEVLVDAAQAVSNIKIDVKNWDCDYLAFSGHKLFGPTGIGILYGKNKKLNALSPLFGGGGMIQKVSAEDTTYLDAPFRFEAGTPHIAGAIGLRAAIDFVESLSLKAIHDYEADLTGYARERLLSVDGIQILGQEKHHGPILSFNIKNLHPQDVGAILDQEGVAVRTGHHCTQPLLRKLGLTSTVRASLSIYSIQDDVDRLASALAKAIKMLG